MESLEELADIFIWFIRVGSVTRVSYCFLKMVISEDEVNVYKRRIKNVVIFHILAESIWALKDLVTYYFT